jgi:pimeloyl-[acyl-carrier protein] methyl ester esterase
MPELPLVFLHGWGLHGGIWQETAAAFSGQYRTVTPDLPGYCGSATVSPYTPAALAEALAAGQGGPCIVCGWSLGGMVALAWAAQRPEQVRGLILVASTPAFMNRPGWERGMAPEVLAGFAADLGQDYRATLLRFLSLQARGGDAAREVVGRLRQSVFARGEPEPSVLAAGLQLLAEVDLRAAAGQVACPTLIVHGGHDTLCPPAAAEWLATALPDARLALQPHAAHAPFLSHPDWFRTTVLEYLHDLDG